MKITIPALILLLSPLAVLIAAVVVQRLALNRARSRLKITMHEMVQTNTFLSLFSQNLKTRSEVEEWMNVTARYVAEIVDARSICVYLRQGDYFRAAGISGFYPLIRKNSAVSNYAMTKPKYILEQLKREEIRPGDGLIGELVLSGRELIINDAMEDERILAYEPPMPVDCLMAIPLANEEEIIGVICAVNTALRDKDSFTADQFAKLKFISKQVVLAQNIQEAYSHLAQQQRISQELEFARSMQRSLLPRSVPVWGRFSVHAFTRASKEVSGDFYDFVQLDEDRLLVVIGDACGKGIPACMVMAMTRSFIRANIGHFTSLEAFLLELNNNLYQDTGDERYITLACCILNKRDVTFEYARAGHTELMLYTNEHIRSFYPEGSGVGLLPSEFTQYDTFCMEFHPGMSAFLFTDGLNEATRERDHKEEFGLERLRNLFLESCTKKETPEEFFRETISTIDTFAGTIAGEDQEDDQTMVMIRHV